MIEVAAAGADGLRRTTAKFTTPGHAQPRPKPAIVPITRVSWPGAASSASPTAPIASITTTMLR
nr:hypothetical protein [Fodinicola feengrottensis]